MSKSLNRTIKAAKMGSQYIITPRLNMFLMQNPNLVVDDWIADLIRKEITKQPRDRSASFSSSASGVCARRQIYQYLDISSGGVNDPQLQSIFYDGTWRHLRWQAVLLQAGILSDIEYPLRWDEMRSRGSMDGVGVVPDDHPNEKWRGMEYGFELKGMNSNGYKYSTGGSPKEDHLNQVHRYFLVGGFDLFVIIYENKDTQEWTEWVIEPDQNRLDAQEKELRELNEFVDQKAMPPMLEGCSKRTGKEWKYCPYGGATGVCVQRDQW